MENNAQEGYSLKKQKLKRWIYENNYTQPYVARKLCMSVDEMKDKLNNRKLFSMKQIRELVYLMTAREAIKVIYFPKLEEKLIVGQVTFLPEGVQ